MHYQLVSLITCLSEAPQLTSNFCTQSFPRLPSVQLIRLWITKLQSHFSRASLRLFPAHTDEVSSLPSHICRIAPGPQLQMMDHIHVGWMDGPNLTLKGSFISIISKFLGDFAVTSMKPLWAKTPPGQDPHLFYPLVVEQEFISSRHLINGIDWPVKRSCRHLLSLTGRDHFSSTGEREQIQGADRNRTRPGRGYTELLSLLSL